MSHSVSSNQFAERTSEANRGGAQPVIQLYRSVWNEVPLVLLLLALAWVGLQMTLVFPLSVQFVELPVAEKGSFALPIPLFAILPIAVFVVLLHRLYDSKYLITAEHVVQVDGRMSLSSKTSEVSFEFVRGIEVTRSFLQRLFDVGDIKVVSFVSNGLSEGGEVTLRGIRVPSHFKHVVEERVRAYRASKSQ